LLYDGLRATWKQKGDSLNTSEDDDSRTLLRSEEMYVALVCGVDPSKEGASGVLTYVLGLTKALAKMGVKVKIIGIGSAGPLQNYDVDFRAVQDRTTTSLRFLFNLMKTIFSLELSKDTIIHAQRPDDLFPFCIFHPRNPKIVTLHGSHSDSVRLNKGEIVGKIYDMIESFTLKRTSSILCVSKSTYLQFQEKYPSLKNKMHLVYIGIDTEFFSPTPKQEARKKLGFESWKHILLYAGRLVKEKRIDLILKAFKYVEAKNDETLLIMVGGGRDEDELKSLARKLSLSNIKFLPVGTKSDIQLLLGSADAIIITSKREGLPTIAMEALACGTPVISTPVGIIPEIVESGINGIIVTDIDELPIIMEKVLVTSSDMSRNCPESVSRFSWELKSKEIVAIYNETSPKG
ncbi:MAG: glycosyltransferase family 4 protein, partial [Candidatus Hodarchaeota archaeon]